MTINDPEAVMMQVVDIIGQMGRGYVVIVKPEPHTEMDFEENWRAVQPGNFQGAIRINGLWHLFYGERPPFSVGDTFEVAPSNSSVSSPR